jgi:hypothetical protein
MKLPRLCGLVLLLILSICVSTGFLTAQQGPPKTMRLCVGPGCSNLTWVGDHYEAREDGKAALQARFWVNQWTPDHVELQGTTAFAADGVFPAEGIFTGKISSAGTSIVDGRDDWRIGYSKSGTMPFTLTWAKPPSTESNSGAAPGSSKGRQPKADDSPDMDVAVVMPEHRSKNNPNILLPAGSAEVYATFPDDVRAFLRADDPVTVKQAKLPCDDVLESSPNGSGADPSITDGAVALEIGRFAIRMGDYARGHCWVSASAELGNKRAKVLYGVIYMMGWGVPKDPKKAFDFINGEFRTRDFWASHFLEKCFNEGIGTPVNKQKAAGILGSEFMIEDAENYERLIGYDDLGMRKSDEIADAGSHPPRTLDYCNPSTYDQRGNYQPGECFYHVDENALRERLQEINEKYDAIK